MHVEITIPAWEAKIAAETIVKAIDLEVPINLFMDLLMKEIIPIFKEDLYQQLKPAIDAILYRRIVSRGIESLLNGRTYDEVPEVMG